LTVPPATPLDELRDAVQAAAADLRDGAPAPSVQPTLERPRKAGFGDFSTNAAMLLAPALKAPPREIAERLGEALSERLGERLERVEVAGPGFLNIFLADAWYSAAAAHILAAGEGYGGGHAAHAGAAERVLVEFVSANPTGPMHVGHGRNAAYGDALARLLAFAGHDVGREFYVNDYGSQVVRFGESIQARARGEDVGEGGYKGAYVAELAAQIPDAATAPVEEVARRGIELMLERVAASLAEFRVEMDTWFSERSLHEDGLVERAFVRLDEMGSSYRSEGALWLRTSRFGDDKDRVLERSTGEHTYFASDIGYHQEKRSRGYDRLIDVWGADHHGYVGRMKAAYGALGGDPDKLELVIMQFVHLVERGGRASMSKRAGEFVTLDELVAEIGVDAARWFLLNRSHDTTIELDLDIAREELPEKNPVHYVRYAHARLAAILREAGQQRVAEALAAQAPAGIELHASERELVRRLLAFPATVDEAVERRAPHRIATYALELARANSAFYRDCPVLKAPSEDLKSLRLGLCAATKRTIARSLDLLGVSAPETM
jgi:arginyl-tRNA synthetase